MSTDQKNVLLWDEEYASKAAKQHKYIFVSSGQKQRKLKLLTGAQNAWYPKKDKAPVLYIYVPEKRIMGLKEDVIAVLKAAGKSESDIKRWVKEAYSKDSHGDLYQTELASLTDYKKVTTDQQKDRIKYTLKDLGWFVDAIKDVKEVPVDKSTIRQNKVSPKSQRDIFRSLYQKAVELGQILDVSQLETSGARLRPTASKTRVQSDTLPLETDNVKNYRRAIEWHFGSTEQYEADIESIKVKLADRKKGTKGTTKKTTPKPEAPAEQVVEKKKKAMGSPRKGAKSPGAVTTKGGENFTSIPPIKK